MVWIEGWKLGWEIGESVDFSRVLRYWVRYWDFWVDWLESGNFSVGGRILFVGLIFKFV